MSFIVVGGSVSAPLMATVELVSVNVGLPRVIGALHTGEPIVSGIVKEPVTTKTIVLDALNLAGDRQADLTVHGGPDKAVYAYPVEHLPLWNAELGTTFGIGTFGENLTTSGVLEEEVCIGDLWQWGDAVLQVSQPRSPCYKLAAVTGRLDILKRMIARGRTGWYLRVLQPGVVPVAGPIQVVARDKAGMNVLRVHRALLPHPADRAELERVASIETLAAAWRDWAHEILEES